MVARYRWWMIYGVAASVMWPGWSSATTFTWTGALDGDWSTKVIFQTNWNGNVVPTSSASNDLVFSSSATTTAVNNDISSPFLLNSLTFGSLPFTLSGGTLELVADGATAPKISVNTATSQTIF